MESTSTFIANRLAFNRQKSFSRFIIRLSIAATIISVAVMIVSISLANGFQEAVSQKIFSFWGHVRIQEKQPDKAIIAEEWPIFQNDTVERAINTHPNVSSISPFATKYALLKSNQEMEGLMVKGLGKNYPFNQWKTFLKQGQLINFPDSGFSRQIIISSYTASRMKLAVGDSLVLYFIQKTELPKPRKVLIGGIYKTGIEDYDKLFAIADIRLIQQLNGWSANQIGGYEIFLKNPNLIDSTSNQLYQMETFPESWDALSIKQASPQIFDWLNMQNTTRNILIAFMAIVAAINLITALLILVLERTRMIGILKSIGANNWTVQSIFLRYSIIITSIGIGLGTLLGLGLLWLQEKTGFIKLNEEAYFLDKAAVKIVWSQIIIIDLGTLAMCTIILLIPSLLVRKISPSRAIQFK
jgi:lipoprotein-releasing system permease protein